MEKEKRDSERPRSKPKRSRVVWSLPSFLQNVRNQNAAILVGLSFILAVLLTPAFKSTSPKYQLGDIADRNTKASRDLLILDEAATVKKQEEAVRQAPMVYDLDESVAVRIQESVDRAFQTMRDFLDCPPESAEPPDPSLEPSVGMPPTYNNGSVIDSASLAEKKKSVQDILGIQLPDEIFFELLDRRWNRDLQEKVTQLLGSILDRGIVTREAVQVQSRNQNMLLRKIGSQEEFLFTPPHSYLDIEEARKLARMRPYEDGWDSREMQVVAYLASHLLQPNLTFNLQETERRREAASSSVKPVFIQVAKSEMLVREGQRIGPEELLKLKANEQKKSRRHYSVIFLTLFLFAMVSIWVVVHVTKEHLPSYWMETRDFLFLGILLVFVLVLGSAAQWMAEISAGSSTHIGGNTLLYAVPLTTGAMMACIFFGVTVSLIFSLLLTLFASMLFGRDFGLFFYFLIGSFVAAHCTHSCRTRMVPIKAGLLVGGANVVLILLTTLLLEQWILLRVLTNAFFGLFGGVFAGILVTGFTPLVEMSFGYVTDIKLLELATMDQPLLQELMVQAPGTYHHSIIVGNMVEAAAKSIGANSLLAKVAAYYHDIGKIKKPLYFIENQFDCENRHEKLSPSMSSLILISHVKDGIELAGQHRLGKAIQDIIAQHHGTSFISFFYKKALEAREKAQNIRGAELPPINMDDYRYPGPKPQTKEAGLVMLADVVEAASRSLTEPTPARIQGMVNRLINNIFSDGQLEDCELTLRDLHEIAKRFNQILATVHHRRIEYPSPVATEAKGKTDAPDSGQRESKPDRDRCAANREISRPDLKRLGIH